jgi:hypothetical protein
MIPSARNHADGIGQPLKVPERRHGARGELHDNPEAGWTACMPAGVPGDG